MNHCKQRFEPKEGYLEEINEFTAQSLRSAGVAEGRAINSANLTQTIVTLMAEHGTSFIGLDVKKNGSQVVIRMVSDGSAYDPLDDLDIPALLDSDPPLPDEDFDAPLPKEQLLKALHNSLNYYRRNHHNVVTFVALHDQPKTLKMVTMAVIAAIVVGLVLRFVGGPVATDTVSTYVLTPLRTIFLNALKMLVVPVVFLSITASVSSVSDIREYGRIGGKVLLFYTCTSFLAILMGYLVYQLLQPGRNVVLDLSSYTYTAGDTDSISILDTIVNIVPTSFVGAFTDTQMLQVIFLAVLVGAAVNLMDNGEDRQKLGELFGLLNRLFLKLASIVMLAIPVATFCAMTLLVVSIDGSMIGALLKLVVGMLLGVVGMFLCYAAVFLLFLRKNPLTFFRKCLPNFVSFITFCSTSAVMPQSLDTCTRRLGISPRISSFSMPLGSTINMDGACVYLTLSALFLAAIYQVPVSFGMMVKLAVTILILSMGAPPIAGAGFICLSILVMQLGVPIEGLGILMGIDQLMSMCRTLINGTGDFLGTAVVANSESLIDFAVLDGKDKNQPQTSQGESSVS
jgi:Na+/H+-dicarboxylate symporter